MRNAIAVMLLFSFGCFSMVAAVLPTDSPPQHQLVPFFTFVGAAGHQFAAVYNDADWNVKESTQDTIKLSLTAMDISASTFQEQSRTIQRSQDVNGGATDLGAWCTEPERAHILYHQL